MDREIQKMKPDYKRIYSDILDKKFPEKRKNYHHFFSKDYFTTIDVLKINNEIFATENDIQKRINQKHRSYQMGDILQILEFQKKHKLSNIALANYFKLSRNTVAKWKRI